MLARFTAKQTASRWTIPSQSGTTESPGRSVVEIIRHYHPPNIESKILIRNRVVFLLGLRLAIPLFAITTLLVVPLQATTSYYAGGASAATNFTGALGSLTLLNPTLLFSGGDLGSSGLYNASGTGIDFLGFDDFFFNTP